MSLANQITPCVPTTIAQEAEPGLYFQMPSYLFVKKSSPPGPIPTSSGSLVRVPGSSVHDVPAFVPQPKSPRLPQRAEVRPSFEPELEDELRLIPAGPKGPMDVRRTVRLRFPRTDFIRTADLNRDGRSDLVLSYPDGFPGPSCILLVSGGLDE